MRWLNSGEKVGASIGCDVEDGVDTEWEHGERILRGEEPYEGHSCGEVRK